MQRRFLFFFFFILARPTFLWPSEQRTSTTKLKLIIMQCDFFCGYRSWCKQTVGAMGAGRRAGGVAALAAAVHMSNFWHMSNNPPLATTPGQKKHIPTQWEMWRGGSTKTGRQTRKNQRAALRKGVYFLRIRILSECWKTTALRDSQKRRHNYPKQMDKIDPPSLSKYLLFFFVDPIFHLALAWFLGFWWCNGSGCSYLHFCIFAKCAILLCATG